MSKGVNVLENTVLAQFLGTDGVQELRTKIIDMIVEEVRNQLHESSYYIISPDDVASDIYNDVVQDIYEEIKEEYKERVADAVAKRFEGVL